MCQVPFLARLTCATSTITSLWTELKVTGTMTKFNGYQWSGLGYRSFQMHVSCSNLGVQRLVQWLPSLDTVTKLDVRVMCVVRVGVLCVCTLVLIHKFLCIP